jgi:hypothetical protein
MANGLTAEPSMMTPSEIRGSVQERIGGGGDGVGQDFQSWRYNVPQGELGTAYPKSRRKMRMEAEYQQSQLKELERMRALQAMDLEMDREARMQRDQDFQFLEAKTREDREKRVQDEAGLMIDAMRGAVAPDGTVIANPIRPEDDNALERMMGLTDQFKYGIENKAAASMYDMLLKDVMKFRESRMEQSKRDESVAANLSAQAGVPMQELGEYTETGLFKPNLNTIVKVNEELKKKEEAATEEKEIEKETRRAEARETVAEKRSKEYQIVGIDKELRREGLALEEVAASLGLQRDQSGRFNIGGLSDTQKKTFRAAENRVRLLEQDKAQLQGFMFDTEADAQAAIEAKTVPKGAIIFINGKKAINR